MAKSNKPRANNSNTKPSGKSNFKKGNKPSNFTAASKSNNDLQEFQCNHNDISWYNANPTMLRTAGSLSFNNPIGIDMFPEMNDYEGSTSNKTLSWTVPGIMQLNMVPTIGATDDANSIANIAARKIYAFVRHENSGHTNYDAPDLMLYILAMDNLYSFYNWITRVYGAIRLYSGVNRYLSDSLLQAMGVNAGNIRKHGHDLYFNLLDWAARLKTFHIPSTMSYLTRHAWLYSQVFKDSPDPKSQLYVFNPSHLYYWAENAESWSLKPIAIKPSVITSYLTYENIVQLMEIMIAGVARSEDFNIMSGDILKAYGNNTFTISPVDISYILEPTFNNSVLMQIHNLRVMDKYVPGDIKNDSTGSFIINESTCESKLDYAYLSHNLFLDLHGEEPSPENVMIASRLMTNWRVVPDTTDEVLDNYGSEVVVSCYVVNMEDEMMGVSYKTSIKTDYTNEDDILSNLGRLIPFGEFPIVYSSHIHEDQGVKTNWGVRRAYNNFDNFTIVTGSTLRKLHECALLSEFGITES